MDSALDYELSSIWTVGYIHSQCYGERKHFYRKHVQAVRNTFEQAFDIIQNEISSFARKTDFENINKIFPLNLLSKGSVAMFQKLQINFVRISLSLHYKVPEVINLRKTRIPIRLCYRSRMGPKRVNALLYHSIPIEFPASIHYF